MPVPSTIGSLSTTASSNSPAGSEAVFPDLDNYIRALSSFIAQLHGGTNQPSWSGNNRVPYFNSSGNLATSSLFVFNSSGNLGIGTALVGAKLHVEGGDFWLRNGSFNITDVSAGAILGKVAAFHDDLTTGGMSFYTADASVLSEIARMKPSGSFRLIGRGSAPTNAEAGDIYYDSTANKHYGYNGFIWNAFY